MKTQTNKNYEAKNVLEKQLGKAFSLLKIEQDVLNFLRDLLTPAELTEFSNRLEIARLLEEGNMSYIEVAKKVGTSTTTVTRVASWLNNGSGGYKKVLTYFK